MLSMPKYKDDINLISEALHRVAFSTGPHGLRKGHWRGEKMQIYGYRYTDVI